MLELHVHGSIAGMEWEKEWKDMVIHSSSLVQEGIADALLAIPHVRMADAGEFSRRAFEHGKLSLTEVEALSDLICSETAAQREQALRQLGGALGKMYERWRAELIALLARVEAVIDFADDELIEEEVYHAVAPKVDVLLRQIREHLQDGRRGEITRQGAAMGKKVFFNLHCEA